MTSHNHRKRAAIVAIALAAAFLSTHCSDETYQGTGFDEPDASPDSSTDDAATDDTHSAQQDTDTEDAATPDAAAPDVAPGVDAAVDPSQRGVVTVVIENVGDEPAYISAEFPFVTRAGGRPRAIAIARETSASHIRLSPGQTRSLSWDGTLLDEPTCNEGDTCTTSPARIEDYVVEVDFSHGVIPAGGDAVTIDGDEIANAALAWPVAEASALFSLSHDPVEVRVEIRAEAPVPEQPFGSCGQAWTYRPDVRPEIAEQPADVRANSTAVVRLRSVRDGFPCVRAGALDITVDGGNHTVAIESGSFVATSECDGAIGEDYIALIFDLTAASWSVGLSGPDGSLVGTEPLEVLACSGCSMCEPSSETRIGDDCQDDCECGGQFRNGASIQELCVAGACAQTCLWSADCPEGYRCDAGVDADGIASIGWCSAAPDEECAADGDCERGVCRDGQCTPRLDFTGLDSDGMGALCACDSECPGDQQCILGPREADVPRCALRCRDHRDCNILPAVTDPAGYECDNQFGDCGTPQQGGDWRCSGHSPSGAPPVCVRD